jgi:hypothetical protein
MKNLQATARYSAAPWHDRRPSGVWPLLRPAPFGAWNFIQPPSASSRKCASAICASGLCVMVMNQTRLKNSDHAVFQ